MDFHQIFSPVVRFESVCLILALAALEGWYLSGLDVRNAYLYGELDEEIYMEQPEGFHTQGKERHVLQLHCALYGLKQAGLMSGPLFTLCLQMLQQYYMLAQAIPHAREGPDHRLADTTQLSPHTHETRGGPE